MKQISVENISFFVGADMNSFSEQFPFADNQIGILQIDRSCPNGFDFGAVQFNSRFKPFLYEIVVKGFSVGGTGFDAFILLHYCPRSAVLLHGQREAPIRFLVFSGSDGF